MITYSELFLILWAIAATALAVYRLSRIKFYQRVLRDMADTTEKIVYSDEARAQALAIYDKYKKPTSI